MPQIHFSELPTTLRVKLSERGREELWHRVDEIGGVKTLSESFDFSKSKMYNWRSKDLALPIKFVRRLMGQNSTSEIILIKGKSSGGKIREPKFPFEVSDELLTRIHTSVKENSEGIPFYITSERSLAERFIELLENLGEVEYKLYSRASRFEVRYPKFLNEIFSSLKFSKDLAALIDEKGEIREEKLVVEDKEVPINEFRGEIYSKEKSFELALQRGNSEKIAALMAEESSKVRKIIGN